MRYFILSFLILLCLCSTFGCEESQTVILGIGHLPSQTAELQIRMAYQEQGTSAAMARVAEERVSVDFRKYRDNSNLFSLFRVGARTPRGIQGQLHIGVAAIGDDGKLLGAGDGVLELPQADLTVGVDIHSPQSTGGLLLEETTASCTHHQTFLSVVEQISDRAEDQGKTRLRMHGFGFLPQAKVRVQGSTVPSQWQSFSLLDAILDLPSAPTGVLSLALLIEQPDGSTCMVTARPRTVTFSAVLSDPSGVPDSAQGYRVLGLPLRMGYAIKDITSGDLDGDGLPDIFLSGSLTQGIGGFLAVLRNRGTATKGSAYDDPEYYEFTQGSGESVVTGDWNADGKLDAAVTSKSQSKVVVFYQQSPVAGQRFRQQLIPGGDKPDFVTKGDIDGDGKIDLITGAQNDINGKSVFLLFNNGASFEMSPPSYFQGVPIFLSDLFFSDMSRDGKSDYTLIYSRSVPMGTELRTIGAVQTFVEQPDGSLRGTGETLIHGIGGRAAIGDLDGNGAPDLVAAGPYLPETQAATHQFSVLFNDGTGTYQQPYVPVDTVDQPYSVGLGDVNLDGKLDVIIANVRAVGNGRIAIHLNQGGGTLASQNIPDFYTDAGYSTDLEVSDINRDGKPDLIILSSATPGTSQPTRLQVLLNTTQR